MRALNRALVAAAGITILAACTGGQSAIQPPSTAADPRTSTLQFRVGTVNYQGTSVYTNTVVTFRQANGLSAVLYDVPTITGPAGWIIPATAPNSTTGAASGAGTDAGTNHISGNQPAQPGTTPPATTFGLVGGAFAYGFAPANSTTGGTAFYAGNPSGRGFGSAVGTVTDVYTQPIYRTSAGRRPFLLGPPITPDFHNPSAGYPAGFLGYDSGFTAFAVTPVAGTYSLHIDVPSSTIGVNSATFDVTANLTSLTPLGNEPAPVITEPAARGAVNFVVGPAPALANQQILYVVKIDGATGALTFWSFNAGATGGTFSLAASNFSATNGDTVAAWTVGADWDIAGDAPPNNTSPAPPLPPQTNITISPINAITYV